MTFGTRVLIRIWALEDHTSILFLHGTIMKYKFFLLGFRVSLPGYLKAQGLSRRTKAGSLKPQRRTFNNIGASIIRIGFWGPFYYN